MDCTCLGDQYEISISWNLGSLEEFEIISKNQDGYQNAHFILKYYGDTIDMLFPNNHMSEIDISNRYFLNNKFYKAFFNVLMALHVNLHKIKMAANHTFIVRKIKRVTAKWKIMFHLPQDSFDSLFSS